jgi:alcohol dehydrogenase class IV
MAVTSLFGGLALANAGLGAVHGFSGPVGGTFSAPHGAVCAALLPNVMAANVRALRERAPDSDVLQRFGEIGRLLTGKTQATADDGVDWIRQLTTDLQIVPLRAYGVTTEHVTELVEKASVATAMKANPIVLTPAELAKILKQAI